jgi:2-polyprenyl-6-methoxyphenol hydroxylase-like FAD-dependent oxidoreductase
VVFRTSVTGIELTRIPIPCRRDRYTRDRRARRLVADAGAAAPHQPAFLEPILLHHTAALPGVTLLNRTQAHRVLRAGRWRAGQPRALDLDTERNATRTLRCRYLVGCDGGGLRRAQADRRQAGRHGR